LFLKHIRFWYFAEFIFILAYIINLFFDYCLPQYISKNKITQYGLYCPLVLPLLLPLKIIDKGIQRPLGGKQKFKLWYYHYFFFLKPNYCYVLGESKFQYCLTIKISEMKKVILPFVFLWLFIGAISSQNNVKGIVTDQAGLPLIGANVTAKGFEAIGTITDVDGNFLLSVPQNVTSLKISYTGYETREVEFTAGKFLTIILAEGKVLEEVVVTALGISKSSKTLGYSTSVVSGDQINITRNTSVLDALNGSVAGLTVSTASGAPGASTVVNIRGFNSVTGNNQPLYVIDGVPMNNRGNTSSANVKNANDDFGRSTDFGNQMNDINPNDIESLNVLKGSAASALYGSRAANGVILITTKKGKSGKMKIDLNTSFSVSDLLRVPFLQNTYGQGWSGLFAYEENGSWGPKTDDKIRRWGNVVNNSQQLKPFSIQENNIRDFFDLGTSSNTSLSISGGNDAANYRLSYSLAKADGVVPNQCRFIS
jgi:TonB-dependent SusC/RagA subfamily outer membrane receptor